MISLKIILKQIPLLLDEKIFLIMLKISRNISSTSDKDSIGRKTAKNLCNL